MADQHRSSVSFSVDASQGSAKHDRRASGMSTKRNSLRSSFFRMRSMSFRRSGGTRGADVNTLRGTNGPDFEGDAIVNRADNGPVLCGCFGGGGDEMTEKIVMIKGPYCFVFAKESDPAPKYAIGAAHMKPVLQPTPSHGKHIVTIETNLGDVEWELQFDKENIAKQFVDSFKEQAAIGESDEVRKRLGHEQLLDKRKSVKYAEKVANKKIEEQPEKKEHVTLDDMERVTPGMAGL